MSINSFDDYPMNWKPEKELLQYPYYRSLAEQLETDIKTGKLAENVKLPPQRELADFLDLNLTTITRAYKHCADKGLIYAVVGRGTFVSPHIGVKTTIVSQREDKTIELGMVLPFDEDNGIVRTLASELLASPSAGRYFDYSYPLGSPFQKQMMRKWLDEFNCAAEPEHILISAGSQNALSIVLSSLFGAGDKIAADCFTYPNFIGLANMLSIQLIPVPGDSLGMNPSELEKACRLSDIKGIFLMPSCSNPTNQCMNAERRSELASVIKKQKLIVLEDDSYAFLAEERFDPIASLVPEQTIYINGFSKPVSAGLRVAAFSFPDRFKARLEQGLYNLNLKTPSLNIEIAAELIRSGIYREIIQKKRERSAYRNQLYREIMGEFVHYIHPLSFFQWLPLPEYCTGKAFEAIVAGQGVHVYGSERFTLGNVQNGQFVRIAVSSPKTAEEFSLGLKKIKNSLYELKSTDTVLMV